MTDELYAGDESSGLLSHFMGRVKTGMWSNLFAETQGKANQDFAMNTMLFWQVDVLDILQANYEVSGTPIEQLLVSYGIGNGWHPHPDNPNLVEHEDDSGSSLKKFHASTAFMKFVYIVSGKESGYPNALVLDGDGDIGTVDLNGVKAIHAKYKVTTLRDASIWNDMIFEFRGLGFKSRNVPDPRPRPYPVRFYGVDPANVPEVGSGSETSTSTTNPAEASNGVGGTVAPAQITAWGEAGAEPATVATLTKLWANAGTTDEFVGNASLLPAVQGNDALKAALVTVEGS